jgi:cytochrome oxidase Cu insertion factor (SCO1/SenC/PrrC family)
VYASTFYVTHTHTHKHTHTHTHTHTHYYPDYYRVLRRSDGDSVSLSSFQGKKPLVLFFCEC